ncbi:hypothetical protein PR048_027846 [Dryococelus australis]|uniref:Uncharacterized protein n=1 Tax=Dryococelus australis TaxID=614101 RepID=A0ABQ9GHP6_9NEOP|nr:hypothetical protein PR048_027846 [Dryococelus australis]
MPFSRTTRLPRPSIPALLHSRLISPSSALKELVGRGREREGKGMFSHADDTPLWRRLSKKGVPISHPLLPFIIRNTSCLVSRGVTGVSCISPPLECPALKTSAGDVMSLECQHNKVNACSLFCVLKFSGRCRWSTGFLGDIPSPPPLHPSASPYSPRFTPIGSQQHNVKSSPDLSTLKLAVPYNLLRSAVEVTARVKWTPRRSLVSGRNTFSFSRPHSNNWFLICAQSVYSTKEAPAYLTTLHHMPLLSAKLSAPPRAPNDSQERSTSSLAPGSLPQPITFPSDEEKGTKNEEEKSATGTIPSSREEEYEYDHLSEDPSRRSFGSLEVLARESDERADRIFPPALPKVMKRRGALTHLRNQLLSSHKGEHCSIPGRFTPDLLKWKSCRTMPLVGAFSSGDLPFPPHFHSGAAPYSARFTLIGSQDLTVKSRLNLFTSLVLFTLCPNDGEQRRP